MNRYRIRDTVFFIGLYLFALLGTGVLAAVVREAALLRFLGAVWANPGWLLGIAVGVGMWLLVYIPTTTDEQQ